MWRSTRRCRRARMRRGAGIVRGTVVRAVTVASVAATVSEAFNRSRVCERISGERRPNAVRGPGNAAQREAPTPGSDVREGALETEPWGRVECALRMPAWRFGGVPSGTGGDRTNLRLLVLLVNPTEGLTRQIVCNDLRARTATRWAGIRAKERPVGPGSQGRSALTTGAPGVDSVVAGPPCEQALGAAAAC